MASSGTVVALVLSGERVKGKNGKAIPVTGRGVP
jgi:hypothetical protein